jgi:fatty acid desaturase
MISKYKINQIIFILNLLVFLSLQFFLYSQQELLSWYTAPALFITVINLHYFLNTLHLASHNLLSKKRQINNIFGRLSAILGGLNFAEFSKTHLQHHLHTSNKEQDPDYLLTKSGHVITLPFRIWVKDIYFWKNKNLSTPNYRSMYIQDRLVQLVVLVLILFSGKIFYFLIYWSFPALVVGLSYGYYLFYFPHYVSKWEKSKRILKSSTSKFSNFQLNNVILWTIDLARYYHTLHHFKVQDNFNYYPLLAYFKDIYNKTLSPKFSTERTFTTED